MTVFLTRGCSAWHLQETRSRNTSLTGTRASVTSLNSGLDLDVMLTNQAEQQLLRDQGAAAFEAKTTSITTPKLGGSPKRA